MARDFDVIAVPWIPKPSLPQMVVDEITNTFDIREVAGPPTTKEHGRLVYTLSIGFGECFCDFSFMPTLTIKS